LEFEPITGDDAGVARRKLEALAGAAAAVVFYKITVVTLFIALHDVIPAAVWDGGGATAIRGITHGLQANGVRLQGAI
jgi:hypothetical protein